MSASSPMTDEDVGRVTLSPDECIELLVDTYNEDIKRAICITGPPGIGKTSVAQTAAKILGEMYPGFDYKEVNPTMPADEVGGIPDLIKVSDGFTVTDYALPKWFPRDPNWRGIICLDDGLQGGGDMQKVLANLVQALNLRGQKVPSGAMFVVTGNRIEDKAGVAKTLTHFADRMCWINMKVTADQWIDGFAIPNGVHDKVIAYIMSFKDDLNKFDPNVPKCPTSRTWEAVSNWTKMLDKMSTASADAKNKRTRRAAAVLAGELGQGMAIKYWSFCERYDTMPDIDDILKSPSTHTIDYSLDVQFALAVAIANRMDDTTFSAAVTYIDRIGPDFTSLAIRLATGRNPKLVQSKAFLQWTVKNQDVIVGRI